MYFRFTELTRKAVMRNREHASRQKRVHRGILPRTSWCDQLRLETVRGMGAVT